MKTTNNFNIISMRTLFPAILGCLLLIGCVRNKSVTTQNDSIKKVQNVEVQSENVQSKGNNILCNIIDSLLKVYPKAMANPIQKSDFIAALDKSVKNLSPHTLNMLVEQIPFSLERVQNVPNREVNICRHLNTPSISLQKAKLTVMATLHLETVME